MASGAGRGGRSRYQYLQSLQEGETNNPAPQSPLPQENFLPRPEADPSQFSGPGSPGPTPFMGQRELHPAPQGLQNPSPLRASGSTATPPARLDSRKLPNPTKGFEVQDVEKLTEPLITNCEAASGVPFPRANTEFIVNDTWSCSPRFMRSTMYALPTTSALQKQAKIPLGIVISPLAEIVPGEYPIPTIDHGAEGPIRCTRCRAYINPFIVWNQSGSQYTCMFCGQQNDTPTHFYSPLINGQRQDMAERPELYRGSVDFIATDAFKVQGRDSAPACYVFLIDTSLGAIQSGLVHSVVAAIQQILPTLLESSPAKVSFITYDSVVSFYNISGTRPSMAVMPDINKPYLPLPHQMSLCTYAQAKNCVDALLESFLNVFTTSTTSSACLGSAVQAACRLLVTAKATGKILLFASSIPETGLGKLQRRLVIAESPQEKIMYAPQVPFYTEMGTTCAKSGFAVDLFACPSAYLDITTLGDLAKVSGGQVYYYPSFSAQNHAGQLFRELFRDLSRETGYDGVIRVRCSTGLTQCAESGHFLKINDTDLVVGQISSDSNLHVEFSYDEALADNQHAYFQCAFLHTTTAGERRIRVHNLKIQTASNLTRIFKAADLDATLNVLIRKFLPEIKKDTMAAVRNNFLESVIEILASYRVNCAKSPTTGQLILPESLRLLPVYTLGLAKTPLFGPLKQGTIYPVLPDARSYFIATHNTISMKDQAALLYPVIYSISDLTFNPQFGTVHEPTGQPFFPGMHRPFAETLASDAIFLIDTVDSLYLWIGSTVNPQVLEELLSPEENSPDVFGLLVPLTRKETDLSQRLFNLLSSRLLQRTLSPEIFIIRQVSHRFNPTESWRGAESAQNVKGLLTQWDEPLEQEHLLLTDGHCSCPILDWLLQGVGLRQQKGSPLEAFVTSRLVEDGTYASDIKEMSYPDFLRLVHGNIQKKNRDKR